MKKLLPMLVNSYEFIVHRKKTSNSFGFTLVELLVVISIIAILSVIGLSVYGNVQREARNARRRADIESIQKVLETHYNNTTDQHCTAAVGTYCAPIAAWFSANALSADPSGAAYTGMPVNGATTYTICATLEPATTPATTFCLRNQR